MAKDVKGLKHEAKEDRSELRSIIKDAKNDLTDLAEKAGRQAREFIDHAGEKVHDASATVKNQVKEHPVKTGLIAVGLGLIARAIFRRRK